MLLSYKHLKLKFKTFKTATGQRSFHYRIVNLWNSLDKDLKELWGYTSQPRAQVNLESRVNLESTTSQAIFFSSFFFCPGKKTIS